MNTVLLVEPAFSGWKLITKGKTLGFKVIVLTSNTDERVIPDDFLSYADIVEFVDTNNEKQTIDKATQLHKKHNINAVIPGFEYCVPLAAKISSQINTKGLNPILANNVRFKDLMKQELEKNGLRIPRFKVVNNANDLLTAIEYVKFPCVIKPVDCSGSINVKKVNNLDELYNIYSLIESGFIEFGRKSSSKALIEEYLAGNEYSIEGFVENGKTIFLSITEKLLGLEPFFIELGHIVSANINTQTAQIIYDYVDKVVKCLNISLGPFHCEIRLVEKKPILIEIGARLAGDHICDLIVNATNCDLYEIIYNCYLGIPNSIDKIEREQYSGIRYFTRPSLKKYFSISGIEEIQEKNGFQEISFSIKPGEQIPIATNNLARIGYVIFNSNTYQDLRLKLEEADKTINFLN